MIESQVFLCFVFVAESRPGPIHSRSPRDSGGFLRGSLAATQQSEATCGGQRQMAGELSLAVGRSRPTLTLQSAHIDAASTHSRITNREFPVSCPVMIWDMKMIRNVEFSMLDCIYGPRWDAQLDMNIEHSSPTSQYKEASNLLPTKHHIIKTECLSHNYKT